MDTERFEKFQIDLLAAEHHFHQRIDKLKQDFQNMTKEFQKQKKEPENIVFDKLITKYWVGFDNTRRIESKYRTQLEGNKISILFPPANRNWSLGIMRACIEICEMHPSSYPTFNKDRENGVISIKINL